MKITFRPANHFERKVRCYYFKHSRPGNVLGLLLTVILILRARFDTGVTGGIKNKNKIMSKIGGHATRSPQLVPRHA